jgi:WD40 repeat protein
VTSASDGIARVWSLNGDLMNVYKANDNEQMLLASKWNKDGTYIASGGMQPNVKIWDPNKNCIN